MAWFEVEVRYVFASSVFLLGITTIGVDDARGGTVAFHEPFDGNENGWAIGEDGRRRLAIEAGEYRIEHRRANGHWSTWHTVEGSQGTHVRVVARLKKLSGVDDHGYGLVFGARGDADKQSFVVSSDGHYRYGVVESGTYRNITGWKKSPSIHRGSGRTNVLEVRRDTDLLHLSINDEVVESLPALQWKGDRVGFEVNHALAVAVEELSVTTGAPAAKPRGTRADHATVVAVFDLVDKSDKTDDRTKVELTEYLIARLAQRPEFEVVPREQLRDELRRSKAKSYDACFEQRCQIELGKAAAANVIVDTRLMRVGRGCVLTATMFDLARETTAHAAVAERPNCDPAALLSAVKEVAAAL